MSRILKTNDRISRFAEKNLKNKKEFGEDARLAFKRHLNDLKRSEKNDPGFPYIFDPEKASEDQAAVLEYIRKHATCKRDSEIEEIRENGGKILALSTCSTDRLSDRTVLLAKMTQRNNKGADQT